MGQQPRQQVPQAEERSKLFWAVIEHYRWWFSSDAVWRQEIERDGSLTGVTCRKIAAAYGVGRGVLEGHECGLARLLQAPSIRWPPSLADRAAVCGGLAMRAKCRGHTDKLQCSAVTKLMWFLRPQGWTMFDSLAANGLNIQHRNNSWLRMQCFYATLEDRCFHAVAGRIGAQTNCSAYAFLWPERILDKYLMQHGRGEMVNLEKNRELACYLLVLRTDERAGLVALADAVVAAAGDAPLGLAN